jgi:hypothetical protein
MPLGAKSLKLKRVTLKKNLEKLRFANHLSPKQQYALRNFVRAAIERKEFVKIFRIVRSCVAEPHTRDSVGLFKNLPSSLEPAAPRLQARSPATIESNALRETRHRVFLESFAAPTALEISAV